jgi:hypothetical protein
MQSYGKQVAAEIINACCSEYVTIRSDGAWPIESSGDDAGFLHWRPDWELDDPDSPAPHEAPGLPTPFYDRHLAAFMLHGVGAEIAAACGAWAHGPDEHRFAAIGILGDRAKDAVRGAYAAFRDAESIVGKFDQSAQDKTQKLVKEYGQRKIVEGKKNDFREQGITDAEREHNRKLAKASVAALGRRVKKSRQLSDLAESVWRKAMVNQLLRPTVKSVGAMEDEGISPVAVAKIESTAERQERRYEMCVKAGLKMPDNDYRRLPDGIGAQARVEGVSTAMFSKDLKSYISRRR